MIEKHMQYEQYIICKMFLQKPKAMLATFISLGNSRDISLSKTQLEEWTFLPHCNNAL